MLKKKAEFNSVKVNLIEKINIAFRIRIKKLMRMNVKTKRKVSNSLRI